ncbi:hypothetical protein [Elongatibacter sediminis]|uniref:Uncharacterized protein n=1 Tax=Elongatibacter sediminis TaxID=3119006 RepID=A0AAW9R7V0_9GAMM
MPSSSAAPRRHGTRSSPLPVRLIIALFLLFIGFHASAQEETQPAGDAKPLKLFESETELALEIEAPWRRLIRDRSNEDPYPATLTWTDETGRTQSVPATVERRGLTRQRVCDFPPIRLRIDKTDVKGTTFRGQKSLKMVTHCDKGKRWEQYYVKEYLAYVLYNQVTDLSFRARPLEVRYVEAEGGSSQSGKFAFLIEDDSDVAKRNDLKKIDLFEIDPEQLEPVTASEYALFQLMIGNVDWSSLGGPGSEKCCHNAKLIGTDTQADLVAIPYDFDSSGIVDAHYAAPNDNLPIRYVTQRLFRGFCVHNPTLPAAREKFLGLETQMLEAVQNLPQLSGRSVKVVSRYLEDFFDILKNDRSFEKNVIRKCRK